MKKFILFLSLALFFCLVSFVFTACNKIEEEATYTVTYDDGVDDLEITVPVDNRLYKEGEKVIIEDALENDGFIFGGWCDGVKIYAAGDEYTMPARNVTFYADWTPIIAATYTITYDLGTDFTGVVPTEENHSENDTFTLAAEPSKSGYKFIGWNNGIKTYAAGEEYTMPAANIIFTAVWAKLYTVTYDLGENYNGTPFTEADHIKGETFTIAAEPSMGGYAFLGWDDGTQIYTAQTAYVMPETDITFTAVWAMYHNVIYDLGDFTDYVGDPITEGAHYKGQTFTVKSAPARSGGYTFVNWIDGDNNPFAAGDTYIMPDKDVTLTAVWRSPSVTTYTVTYDLGENYTGDPITEIDHAAGDIFRLASVPEMSGYKFLGWNDGESTHPADSNYTMPQKSVVFTAVWAQYYFVLYELGYNTDNDNGQITGYKYYFGEVFTIAAAPTRDDGYTFLNWSDGVNTYAAGASYTMPNNNVTFTAQWSAPGSVKYSVTYNLGEDYTGEPVIERDHAAGAKFTLASAPRKEGYKFLGWNDGEATYAAGAEYIMPAKNVTFTPVFGILYSVTYDLGSDYTGRPITEEDHTAGETFLLAAAPKKAGYKFKMWEEGDKTYSAGEEYVMPARSVTITAVWEKLYSVTYDLGPNYTGDPLTEGEFAEGETFPLAAAPQITGYKFLSWKVGDETYPAGEEYIMPAHNVTFTADWETLYLITFDLGDCESEDYTDGYYSAGDTINLAVLEMSGYTFIGWYAPVQITVGLNKETVYAVLSKNNTYSVLSQNSTIRALWQSHTSVNLGVNSAGCAQNVLIGCGEDNSTAFKLNAVPAGYYEISLTGDTLTAYKADGESYSANITVKVGSDIYTLSENKNSQSVVVKITADTLNISIYADAVLVDITVTLKALPTLSLDTPTQITIPESGETAFRLLLEEYDNLYVITLDDGDEITMQNIYGERIFAGEHFEVEEGFEIIFKGKANTTFTATLKLYNSNIPEPDDDEITVGVPKTITLPNEGEDDLKYKINLEEGCYKISIVVGDTVTDVKYNINITEESGTLNDGILIINGDTFNFVTVENGNEGEFCLIVAAGSASDFNSGLAESYGLTITILVEKIT